MQPALERIEQVEVIKGYAGDVAEMHLRVDERPADGDVDAAAGGAGEEASLRSEMDVVGTGEMDINVAVAGDRPVLVDVIWSPASSPEHTDSAGIAADIEIKRES